MNSFYLQLRRLTVLIVGGGVLILCPSGLSAIEIEETRWGFSGRVVSGEFNPFSVRISNPTAEPVEGTLHLQKTPDGMRMVGVALKVDYYLSPFATRWVQFFPYNLQKWEEWKLSWGEGDDKQMLVPKPQFGEPEPVLLVEGEGLSAAGTRLKRFPDELLPANVSGMQGLRSVILDHVPRWEATRQLAFLDWLHAGGTVHVVQESNGRFPVFPERLGLLNVPTDRRRVGDGVVLRHAAQIATLDADAVEPQIARWEMVSVPSPNTQPASNGQGGYPIPPDLDVLTGFGSDQAIFSALRSITRPQRNWLVIYVLALAYLAAIFPGCYVVGRVQSDWRVVYGALLAGVFVFTLLLAFVGRRSYSEPVLVRSVGIAQPVADGGYDVLQWSDVAVASGGEVTISHGGTGRVYSTCESMATVAGEATFGPEAHLTVSIPPFSSQGFAQRMRISGEPMEVTVNDFLVLGGELQELTLTPGKGFPIDLAAFPDPQKVGKVPEPPSRRRRIGWGGGFPSGASFDQMSPLTLSPFRGDPQQVYVLYGDRIYRLQAENGQLKLAGVAGSITGLTQGGLGYQYGFFDPDYDRQRQPDEVFHSLCGQLIGRSLGLSRMSPDMAVRFPTGRMRLFIYAKLPKALRLQSEGFDDQDGYLLFIQDVPTPENV